MKPRRDSDVTSSGRIERKRAHDREAQRASRAKTKAYIAHLEKTVADLTESSGDDRAHYLAQHASKQSQEIENLQGLVQKIRTLITDAARVGDCSGDSPLKLEPFSLSDHTTTKDSSPSFASPPACGDSAAGSPPKSPDRVSAEFPHPSSTDEDSAARKPPSSTRNLVVLGESMLCEENDDRSFFGRLNRVISRVEASPDHLSLPAVDEDIVVRAIVDGWDAAERLHHFDIVWRFLRAYDEGFWFRARGPVERLAHVWLMRSTMLHKMCPANQPRRAAPAFMNPTLHQLLATPHLPLADYYAWPRVRDLVIDRGGLDVSGRTSCAFIRAIRFDWPYTLRDVYLQNTATGLYELSAAFLQRFNNLASYRLESPRKLAEKQRQQPEQKAQDTTTTAAATAAAAAAADDANAPPLHPALACAAALDADALLGWHDAAEPLSKYADLSGLAEAAAASPVEAAAATADVIGEKAAAAAAAQSWMPSLSMDIGAEAAFLEFAMSEWPVL